MKKIIALMLAAVLALVCVSALAGNSKNNNNMNYGSTSEEEGDNAVALEKTEPTDDLQKIIDDVTEAGKDGGDATKGLPEEGVKLVPEDKKTINEMDCYHLTGDPSGLDELELTFTFATPFADGEEVPVLFVISPAEGPVEWLRLTGVGNADGAVVVKVTKAELAKISTNPFLVMPLSK